MLTPLDDGEGAVLFAVTPPAILARLGLVAPDERWILTHAMYGLRQSPKLWSVFRDKTVKAMKIELDGELWQFRQGVAEPNLWYLFKLDDATTTGPEAVLLIYVDDLLICGPDRLVKAIATSVSTTWKTSDLDVVEPNHGIRFLGCEIEVNEAKDTYWIHQKPYVMELIRQHQVPETARSPIPCPREMLTLAVSDDEPKGDEGDLRRAQRLCGELLWLSQRSRPDISFPVSIMGSLLTKAAPRSIQIGTRLLSYLQRTMGVALEIKPSSGGFEAWSDCSYAPSGCRSHSGMAITWNKAVIGWRSGRQPFTCLSTAEGELVAAIETLVLAMSLKAIVDEFGVSIADMTLCIDNRAALSLATPGTSASWRTRHLRIRSAFLREKVDQGEVRLRFVPGRYQLADLLTKGFPRQRLEELNALWSLVDLVVATTQLHVVKLMVMMTMMVQSARASSVLTKDPLAIDTPWELYLMVALVAVAVVAGWECLWGVWYYVTGQETPAELRKARRLKRMQEVVQQEIASQMGAAVPLEATSSAAMSSSSTTTRARPSTASGLASSPLSTEGYGQRAPSMSTAGARGKTVYKDTQRDKSTQTEAWMIPSPRPLIQYVDREVPVPTAEPDGWTRPLWVSEHGEHFHTLDYCWGLRNSKNKRRLTYCTVCRDNFGRSMYPERATRSGG